MILLIEMTQANIYVVADLSQHYLKKIIELSEAEFLVEYAYWLIIIIYGVIA